MRLLRLARAGAIERLDAHARDPDGRPAIDRFAGVISPEQCRAAMQLLVPKHDGTWRARSGVDAILTALDTRPAWRLLTWLPRLPGLHALLAWTYTRVARHRLSISARLGLAAACDDTCAPSAKVHVSK